MSVRLNGESGMPREDFRLLMAVLVFFALLLTCLLPEAVFLNHPLWLPEPTPTITSL
jgi:hypothetical protein